MPFTIAAFVTRKPELSPTELKAAYEAHVPFLKETVGSAAAPQTITRHYVARQKNDAEKVESYAGNGETFGYDLIAFLTFKDEEHAKVFQAAYGENEEKIVGKVAEFATLNQFRVIAFEDAISN